MAEVSKDVLKKGVKLASVHDFRTKYAGNITSQAVKYAIKHDLIDYIEVGPKVNIIVLTEKTMTYIPNPNIRRETMHA